MGAKIFKKALLLVCTAMLVCSSCKEDEILQFDGESNVYFSLKRWSSGGNSTGYNYTITDFSIDDELYSMEWKGITTAIDSVNTSLALDGTDVGYHVELLPISVSGHIVDYDRPLKFSIGEHTTAVEGVHFEAEGKIPANKRVGAIAVKLNRTNMRDQTVVIDFTLEANEYFQTNYTTIKRSATDTTKVNMQQFRLVASSFLLKPPLWDSQLLNYLGKYSQKKMFVILEATQGDINQFYKTALDRDLMVAWGKLLKWYLKDQETKGNIILDEDGTVMTAGIYA